LTCGKKSQKKYIFQFLVFFLSLIKNYKQRPKYGELMLQPFFIQSREEPVDVAGWYRDITGAAMEKQRR